MQVSISTLLLVTKMEATSWLEPKALLPLRPLEFIRK